MKRKIYELVEKGSFGRRHNQYFDYFIATLIILNVLAVAVESISSLNDGQIKALRIFEIISLLIFTVEYLMRVYVSDITFPSDSKFRSVVKFFFSPLGLIDLFTIIPFYLPLLLPMDLRVLRLFRLLRFMRVFKFAHYNKAFNLIRDVIREKKAELSLTFFMTFIVLVVASFLMYFFEGKVQPENFTNIFASFWWAIATLTTVGYGDIIPITVFGKVLSAIVSLLGIGIVALPTGIISSGFVDKMSRSRSEKYQPVCPHCGKELKSPHQQG